MTDDQREVIERNPAIYHGQAVAKMTRIRVSVVLDALASGITEDETVAEYPALTVQGVRAAAAYRAELARDEYLLVGAE